MKLFNKIKKSIADFKEWVSPWYPEYCIENRYGTSNSLNFKEYAGKRFVPREIKLFNRVLPAIFKYGSDEYLKKYKLSCTDWGIVLHPKDSISFTMYAPAGQLELHFNFCWYERKTWTIDTIIYEIVEETGWKPGTLDHFTDEEGRIYQKEMHYGPNNSGFITYLQGVS